MTDTPRHFLDIEDFSSEHLRSLINFAKELKSSGNSADQPLKGKTLAMIFNKPSTRTRVSFDVGMRQLGGETIVLSADDMQLGRGESIADTAKVLSRYVDAIMIRTTAHDNLLELAKHATVPVINALTDESHPCQIMADVMTLEEHRGDISGKKLAWSGDGNNVLNSLMQASAKFGFDLSIATPAERPPNASQLEKAVKEGAKIEVTTDAESAAKGADCIVTDTWVSMGDEQEASGHNTFQPFQVNEFLMKQADKNAVFMHCLPAHRGEEVTADVIDGPQSIVFDEAENRLHAQKAILAWCMAAFEPK